MTAADKVPLLCRDCQWLGRTGGNGRSACAACGSLRLVRHPELLGLQVAHVDADAFYASVEKRRRPELASQPVIVGGGRRGVVTTACYVARLRGVRSAMPMFKALRLCPDAVVLRPDFAEYGRVSRALRALMLPLTPLVQPLSIDEAVLDLSGTEALHGAPAAVMLARLAQAVERELGITISIGLARNRLLAKLAAGRDKPRGFSVLGADAGQWLADKPVRLLPGVGPAQERRLAARGLTRLGQLQGLGEADARRLLGDDGPALAARARGEDPRPVQPGREARSVSAETTFESDLAGRDELERRLWALCEKLGPRLRAAELSAAGVVLKLRTSGFATRTRSVRLPHPTVLPERLFEASRRLLARELDGSRFRLIGIGAQPLRGIEAADPVDLGDPRGQRQVAAQRAIDALRSRFGQDAVRRGRSLDADQGGEAGSRARAGRPRP